MIWRWKSSGGKLLSAKNGSDYKYYDKTKAVTLKDKSFAAVPSRQSDDGGDGGGVAVASAILLLIIKNWPSRDRFVKYSRHNSSRVGVSSVTDHSTIYIHIIWYNSHQTNANVKNICAIVIIIIAVTAATQ